jgi:cation:H+ antiporter
MVSAASFVVYIASFIAIWFGSGLIIQSIDKIARKLRISSFAISFFILGILTSIPETAVSINAVLDHNPEVFVGTLLGGTVVMFLFVIPILALLGKGVKLSHDLDSNNLRLLLAVIALPGLMIIDQRVTNLEGFLLVASYVGIFYFIQRKHGIFEKASEDALAIKAYSFTDMVKVAGGIGIVYISSQYIVSQTMIYAQLLNIHAFYLSLLVLAVGTNLPELSLAIRAVTSGKKDIAFADYLGSAAANTLLFGVFTLINDGEVLTVNSFVITFLFIVLGLVLFYFFSQSRKDISRQEGFILLLVYIIFVLYEISKGFSG